MSAIPVWIDCDPGHDDALALLLAAYSPEIEVLGVSIVHGNDQVHNCALNAIRFLWTCGITGVPIFKGTDSPIVRDPKYCPEIHGVPGEAGVSGMCGFHFPDEAIFNSDHFNSKWYKIQDGHGVFKMVETIMNHDKPVTVVACGAHTNIALAIRLFPDVKTKIHQIVFMGGAIGLGNTGISAEFNIEIDPEAAHIVLHSGIPLVMIPLEVTHTVLLTDSILDCILNIHSSTSTDQEAAARNSVAHSDNQTLAHPHIEYNEIHARIQEVVQRNTKAEQRENVNQAPILIPSKGSASPFANCCHQLLTFFKSTYFNVFSFTSPPLHDPCTIFYLVNPVAFKTIDIFVDVELNSGKCTGRTLCDIHGLLKRKPNVKLCTSMDVFLFWKRMLNCLQVADVNSPLNRI